ncbi:MAG: glycosyltransferase family 39 protein [Candidatus Shapirobacteria bacterium]|nr:glycosyltransferase family 39 protein [Candidatus Shapirobacteria bacterium]MDD4410550.1 glycosyltransferase family 39 protein [Candidatus Shapirobacteria bacterium]
MKYTSIAFKIFPIFLIAFSLFLYLYKMNSFPPSLFSDEADANYQAFVFNNRGTDYFGNKLPIHFHSYSDWRTSLYIYSIAIVQRFIGHVDLAARLPAAIFGVLSVFVYFLILKNLYKNPIWAMIGSFLFSITPWLFHYSRVGFEATGMLLFLLLGFYFWIKFINQKNDKFLISSAISFVLTIYFYSTAKLFLFFIAIIFLILWFKTIINISLKTKIILFLIGLITLFPFLSDTLKGRSGYRFSYINIFSDPTVSKTVDYLRYDDSVMVSGQQIGLKPMLISKIFHNKLAQWSEMFIKNYFSAFSTEFLFLKGDGNLRQGIQTAGNLLFPDLLLIIIGISSIFYKKSSNCKFYLFFLISLICAPIPFALTRDSAFPHATRLILMLPFLSIFSLLGLKQIFEITKSKIIISLILFLYILCFGRFSHQYYFHYPNISAKEWHYGMKEAVLKIKDTNYSKIYFINSYEPFTPFFLNYSEYLPSNKNISPAASLISDNNQFFNGMQTENKYYLGNIEWSILFNNLPSNSLFVIPDRDLIKVQNSLHNYNKKHSTKIKFNQIDKVNKKYTEQEEFYLVNFDFLEKTK